MVLDTRFAGRTGTVVDAGSTVLDARRTDAITAGLCVRRTLTLYTAFPRAVAIGGAGSAVFVALIAVPVAAVVLTGSFPSPNPEDGAFMVDALFVDQAFAVCLADPTVFVRIADVVAAWDRTRYTLMVDAQLGARTEAVLFARDAVFDIGGAFAVAALVTPVAG